MELIEYSRVIKLMTACSGMIPVCGSAVGGLVDDRRKGLLSSEIPLPSSSSSFLGASVKSLSGTAVMELSQWWESVDMGLAARRCAEGDDSMNGANARGPATKDNSAGVLFTSPVFRKTSPSSMDSVVARKLCKTRCSAS